MKIKMPIIPLLSSLLLFFNSYSSAQVTYKDANVEQRQVPAFNSIKTGGGITVHISQGNESLVAVSAGKVEYRDRIITEVVNGELRIHFKHSDNKGWKDYRNTRLVAYVSVNEIEAIKGSAGANIKIEGNLKTPSLKIELSSGSHFSGNVQVPGSLKIAQSSGSIIQIGGKVADLSVSATSGSQFNGYDLEADDCDASTNSGANIQLTVNKKLEAGATSGGVIYYKGSGVITAIKTNSGGMVSKKS